MTPQVPSDARQGEVLREPAALDDYQKDIASGLSRAFDDKKTEEQALELGTARVIIFSDHHRGARDGADDFLRCERAYHAALGYYLEAGHRLVVLGDVEELWECQPKEVLGAYRYTTQLEGEFHGNGRYERFWGNHDDHWRHEGQVSKHLGPLFGDLKVREALKVRVVDEGATVGLLFLVHGHQGTLDSDRFAWFSRLFVRYVWRPVQRRLNMPSTTPAQDFDLRERHDVALFAWARAHPAKPLLIAGHTHRPVFLKTGPDRPAQPPVEDLKQELDALRASGTAGPEELAKLHARLELVRAELRRGGRPALKIDPPCYFNTGCCSFGDGDVTGIEIVDGEIRLVRWLNDDDEPLPKVLATADFREVLAAVQGRG